MSSISSWLSAPPNNFSTTLSSGIANNTLTIPLNSVTGLGTEGVGVIFKKDADGAVDATTVEFIHWTNVSGLSLTLTDTGDRGIDGSYGAAAQAHDANDYFEVWVSSQYYSSQYDGFTVEHAADGTHDATKVAMLAGTQTFTGAKTFSSTVNLSSATVTLPSAGVRNNPRTTTEASSATPTINTDNTDIHTITALATAITSMTTNLSGTPVNGQKLIIRIKDNGTARAITWGASFASRGATLPTTTVLGKYHYVGLIYNSTASIWDCVAAIVEA